jgi:hypothetical protein
MREEVQVARGAEQNQIKNKPCCDSSIFSPLSERADNIHIRFGKRGAQMHSNSSSEYSRPNITADRTLS